MKNMDDILALAAEQIKDMPGVVPSPTPFMLTEDLWLFPVNSPRYFETQDLDFMIEDTPSVLVSTDDNSAWLVDLMLAEKLLRQFLPQAR